MHGVMIRDESRRGRLMRREGRSGKPEDLRKVLSVSVFLRYRRLYILWVTFVS